MRLVCDYCHKEIVDANDGHLWWLAERLADGAWHVTKARVSHYAGARARAEFGCHASRPPTAHYDIPVDWIAADPTSVIDRLLIDYRWPTDTAQWLRATFLPKRRSA